jgi:hypothetical protein
MDSKHKFNFETDLSELSTYPKWPEIDPPDNALAIVAHSISRYQNSKRSEPDLSFNLVGIGILGATD